MAHYLTKDLKNSQEERFCKRCTIPTSTLVKDVEYPRISTCNGAPYFNREKLCSVIRVMIWMGRGWLWKNAIQRQVQLWAFNGNAKCQKVRHRWMIFTQWKGFTEDEANNEFPTFLSCLEWKEEIFHIFTLTFLVSTFTFLSVTFAFGLSLEDLRSERQNWWGHPWKWMFKLVGVLRCISLCWSVLSCLHMP